MLKLSEKSRKILRAIYRGLGVTAVSTVFFTCQYETAGGGAYGMPPDYWENEEILITGCVISKKTNDPIDGICIYINDVPYYSPSFTYSNGMFYIYAPIMDEYTIIITDIDGGINGRYKQQTITITKDQAQTNWDNMYTDPFIILLEEEDETEAEQETGEEENED